MWDEHNTRKPMLLFRLSGLFLLRFADRALSGLLFQDPPRSTRPSSQRAAPPALRPAVTLCAGYPIATRGKPPTGKIARRRRFAPSVPLARHFSDQWSKMGDEHNTRKPMLSSR